MKRGPLPEDRSGFALALVVLMLFAITIAGGAAYRMVSTELSLATEYRDSQEALSVARAGLQRFLGEQIGVVGDSVSYAIGNGISTVTTRRVVERDARHHLYYVRSEGTVTDPRRPGSPARRVVGTYAWLHLSPVPHKAALMAAMDSVDVSGASSGSYATVDGYDHTTSSDCVGGGTAGVVGAIAARDPKTSAGGLLFGNPARRRYSSVSAVIDSANIRWDILSNPNFPVEFDGSPPPWSSLPADSFPIVRYVGSLDADGGWAGRGVLIVTGNLTMDTGFSWNGIILAGSLADVAASAYPAVNGLLIGGMNGTDGSVKLTTGYFYYNSCAAYAADRALSYLDPVDNTVFEVN